MRSALIQVHPNKHNSEIGFAKENAAGIPMDAAERNYKDPNHKPELVFALTPFLAMNAFREFSESFPPAGRRCTSGDSSFLQQRHAERLSELFANLLNMQGEEKSRALAILKSALDSQQGEPWQTIRLISEFTGRQRPVLPAVTQCGEIESWRSDVPVR